MRRKDRENLFNFVYLSPLRHFYLRRTITYVILLAFTSFFQKQFSKNVILYNHESIFAK